MLLSKLKKLKWEAYQLMRNGETGVITLQATPGKGELPVLIEFGWAIVRAINNPARLVRNLKHPVVASFQVDMEPDGNTLDKFVDDLDWRPMVSRTLPPEVQKDLGVVV